MLPMTCLMKRNITMYPQLSEMVGRERDQDQLRQALANELAKTLLAQRPRRYRGLATWLADRFVAAGRMLQTLRSASEVTSK
jgi:hypothetical protein